MSISTTDTNKPATHSQASENPTTTVPHVVIIGEGFGGLQVAKDLGKQPVKVTVIDKNNFHFRYILHGYKKIDVLMAEVTGIDTQEQCVHMQEQSLHYDYLIVATGATSNYFGHPD